MSTAIEYKFRINGNTTYDCASYDIGDEVFSAMLVDSEVSKVRENLSSINLLEILNKDDVIIYSTQSFNRLSYVSLKIGFGYDDNTHSAFDMILVGFTQFEIEEKIQKIEEKIGEIDSKISPVYNPSLMTLEELQDYKVSESKRLLKQYLEDHPLESSCHRSRKCLYAITEEKQSLMTTRYTSFKAEQLVNPDAVLKWNESGQPAEEWTEKEFLQLLLEIKYRVEPLVSHQQEYESRVRSCDSKEEILVEILNYDSVEYVAPVFG